MGARGRPAGTSIGAGAGRVPRGAIVAVALAAVAAARSTEGAGYSVMILGGLGNPGTIVGVPAGVVVALMGLPAAHQKTVRDGWREREATERGRAIDGGSGRGRCGGQEVVAAAALMAGAGGTSTAAAAEVKAEV